MRFRMFGLGACALALAACTPATVAKIEAAKSAAVADGQLFCAVATEYGPMVVRVVNALDARAVIVTGVAAPVVASTCAVIGAIPVSPPAAPEAAPVVAVKVPAGA